MSKPAARLTDMHVCPMVTGTVPHVGGPVSGPGVPTVLIGGMPAAVMGDMCVCTGPPDSIILGSAGVLIGGKPAARMGDFTSHGGSITLGCFTVLIGEVGMAVVTPSAGAAMAGAANPSFPASGACAGAQAGAAFGRPGMATGLAGAVLTAVGGQPRKPQEPDKLAYLHVVVETDDGKPVGRFQGKVKLPDGKEEAPSLNHLGAQRFGGLPQGQGSLEVERDDDED